MVSFSFAYAEFRRFFELPFEVQWRYLLIRLTSLVPAQSVRLISRSPYPFVLKLPGRGKHRIRVFVWVPEGQPDDKHGFPVHIDFHGGNFFMGSCLEQAPYCALLAARTRKVVVTVNYRMGPLHKFPDAITDSEDVLKALLDAPGSERGSKMLRQAIVKKTGLRKRGWSEKNILRPDHLSMSGFSSGGNIVLNLALSVKSAEGDWPSVIPETALPVPILLFFPSFDQSLLEHERSPPKGQEEEKPSKLALSEKLGSYYIPDDGRDHPRISPGLADMADGLHQRARIFLVLPEIDTLADQSEEWLHKMEREKRIDCVHVQRCPGMKHGWTQFPDQALSKEEQKAKTVVYDQSIEYLERIQEEWK